MTDPKKIADGELSEEIVQHVRNYDVPDGDPRRRYTEAQLWLAASLAVRDILASQGQDQ